PPPIHERMASRAPITRYDPFPAHDESASSALIFSLRRGGSRTAEKAADGHSQPGASHAAALCSRPDCPAQQTSGGFEKSRQCHSYRSEPERSGAASVQLRAVRTAAPRPQHRASAILLGTERLRTLVLTCSVMQFAG